MTPDAHGYYPCVRCRVLRPRAELLTDHGEKTGLELYRCADDAVCTRLAGAGQGRLDADTGAILSEPSLLDAALRGLGIDCVCSGDGPCLEHEPDDADDTGGAL